MSILRGLVCIQHTQDHEKCLLCNSYLAMEEYVGKVSDSQKKRKLQRKMILPQSCRRGRIYLLVEHGAARYIGWDRLRIAVKGQGEEGRGNEKIRQND